MIPVGAPDSADARLHPGYVTDPCPRVFGLVGFRAPHSIHNCLAIGRENAGPFFSFFLLCTPARFRYIRTEPAATQRGGRTRNRKAETIGVAELAMEGRRPAPVRAGWS